MYGTISGNGKYDMTEADIIAQVRECPVFSDPDEIAAESIDDDGVKTQYTGRELCDMAGIEIEVGEQ